MSKSRLIKAFLLFAGYLVSCQFSYSQVPSRQGDYYYIPYRKQSKGGVQQYGGNMRATATMNNAVAEMNRENYKEAEQYFTKYLSIMSGDYRALIYRGICRYMNNDLHFAIRDLKRAVNMNRNENKDLYKLIGTIYCAEGKYEKAIRFLNKSLAHSPFDPEIYNNLGKCYQELDDLANAYKCYNKAIQLDSTMALVYNNRGSVVNFSLEYMQHVHPDDITSALKDFEKALAVDSTLEIAWRNKGVAQMLLKRYNEALASLNYAIQLDSTDYLAYFQRSILYSKTGKFDLAEKDIFRCMYNDHINIQATLVERGNILLYQEQYSEALAFFSFYAHKSFQRSFKAVMSMKSAEACALDNNQKKAIYYLKRAKHKGYFNSKIRVKTFLVNPYFKNLNRNSHFLSFRSKVGKILL
ncbi:MAG: tetratricopeptide repeat protein [Bacteroidia bacterium]|nr:tetratricopeptide repeat protein [Bacteroidia bacterium]